MTRFSRAKGSKSSNERLPEEATSWSEMKKQLLEKNQEDQEQAEKRQANQKRVENYQAFLKQVDEEQTKNVKWAEFSEKTSQNMVQRNKVTEASKAKKKKLKVIGSHQGTEKKKKIVGKARQNEVEDNTQLEKLKSDGPNVVAEKKVQKKEKTISNKDLQVNGEQNLGTQSGIKKKQKKKKNKAKLNSKEPIVDVQQKKAQDGMEKTDVGEKQSKPQNVEETGDNKKQKKKRKNKTNANEPVIENQQKGTKRKLEKSDPNIPQKKLKPDNPTGFEKKDQKPFKPGKNAPKQAKTFNKFPNPQSKKRTKDGPKPERKKLRQSSWIINGKEVEVSYVDGFPIKKEDAERIRELRRQMIAKGIPQSEMKITLKLERRKAEKAFAREKKKVCFNCRKSGHNLSECPNLNNQIAESSGTGICFKCGSTEHTHFECKVVKEQQFKFAQCFVCNEQGHIARQCPDNARGLYPKGGACKVCGDVTHLKRDCPKFQAQQKQLEQSFQVETMGSGDNPEDLEGGGFVEKKSFNKPNKVVKF